MVDASTLKKEVAEGVDIMVLRELTGGNSSWIMIKHGYGDMGDTFLWHSSNTDLVELSLLWQSDYTLLCFYLTQASSPLQVKYADGELERLGMITV